MHGFAKVTTHVSIFSAGLALLLMLIKWRSVKKRYFFFLGLLIIVSSPADLANLFLVANFRATTYLLNIQDIFQFSLLLLIYREFYLKSKKQISIAMYICYLGFETINSTFFQKFSDHQTWTWTVSGIILIGTSIGYCLDMLEKLDVENILTHSPVWINAAVMFYFSLSLYLLVSADFLIKNASIDTSDIFWGLHNLNSIIKNCLFSVGIYLNICPGPNSSR